MYGQWWHDQAAIHSSFAGCHPQATALVRDAWGEDDLGPATAQLTAKLVEPHEARWVGTHKHTCRAMTFSPTARDAPSMPSMRTGHRARGLCSLCAGSWSSPLLSQQWLGHGSLGTPRPQLAWARWSSLRGPVSRRQPLHAGDDPCHVVSECRTAECMCHLYARHCLRRLLLFLALLLQAAGES
jgi:hypothetical protein